MNRKETTVQLGDRNLLLEKQQWQRNVNNQDSTRELLKKKYIYNLIL